MPSEISSLLERGEHQCPSSSSSSSSGNSNRHHATSIGEDEILQQQPMSSSSRIRSAKLVGVVVVFLASFFGVLILYSDKTMGSVTSRAVQSFISAATIAGASTSTGIAITEAEEANEEEEEEEEENDSVMKGTDDWLGEKDIGVDVQDVDIDNEDEEEDTSRKFSLKREGCALLDFFAKTPTSALTYSFFADHTAVVEPYTKTELVVFDDSTESGFDETNNFRFSACPVGGTTDQCQYGISAPSQPSLSATIIFECASFDTYDISVSKFTSDWVQSGDELTGTAVCMYVRREIRELTDADLSKTMDAMYALWSTSQEDGEAMYGKTFKNSTYFASAHDFNAAWQDSDHIHEGLGFLPQHIKLTNKFEEAMQAVDPSITLPYWDFTIDYAKNLTIFESPVFTSQTFGTLREPTDHYWGWTYKVGRLRQTPAAPLCSAMPCFLPCVMQTHTRFSEPRHHLH